MLKKKKFNEEYILYGKKNNQKLKDAVFSLKDDTH